MGAEEGWDKVAARGGGPAPSHQLSNKAKATNRRAFQQLVRGLSHLATPAAPGTITPHVRALLLFGARQS